MTPRDFLRSVMGFSFSIVACAAAAQTHNAKYDLSAGGALSVPGTGGDSSKKNICSITINSDDEIKVFRDKLDSANFKFTELVADPNDPNWLTRACTKMNEDMQRGQRGCDVLVISGHFGGVFFGESNASLDIDELDRQACARTCDGILKQPKEIFLMGCNTLASKQRDRRSDDEYLKILVADGVPRDFAERVVAYRYGEVGYSLEQRMSAIFSSSPRIYGFASTGPVGVRAAPSLKNYFNRRGNYSSHLNSIGNSSNNPLQQSFAGTSFRQIPGDAGFAQRYYGEACGLLGSNDESRVRAVDQLISSGRFFAHADKAVGAVIDAQRATGGRVPDSATIARWKSNSTFMSKLRSTQDASPSLHEIRSDLRYMQDLLESGPYSSPMLQNQSAILKKVLSKPLNFISKDQVCAIARKHPELRLDPSMLPAQSSWNSFTLEAVGCFAIIHDAVSENLVNIALERAPGSPPWLIESAKRFLSKRQDLPSASQEKIFLAALNVNNPTQRAAMLRSLASLENPPNWPNLVGAIGSKLGFEEKDAVAGALAQRLRSPRGDTNAWVAAYVDPMLNSDDPIQQEVALLALQKAHMPGASALVAGRFMNPTWVKPENAVLYAQVLRSLDFTSAQRDSLSRQLDQKFPHSGASVAVLDPAKDSAYRREPSSDETGQVWDYLNARKASIKPRQCLESTFRLGTTKAADDGRWWCLEQAAIKPNQHECFAIASEIRGESRSGAYWHCLQSTSARLTPEVCDSAAQSIADAGQGDDLRWNCIESLKRMRVLDEASCLRLAEGMSLRGQKIRANWNCLEHFSRPR